MVQSGESRKRRAAGTLDSGSISTNLIPISEEGVRCVAQVNCNGSGDENGDNGNGNHVSLDGCIDLKKEMKNMWQQWLIISPSGFKIQVKASEAQTFARW